MASAYFRARRVAREMLARSLPGPRRARVVVVVGTPRSGTSWVARCLAQARGVAYYYEPDRELVAREEAYYYPYLTAADKDPVLEAQVERMRRGRICSAYQIWESSLGQLLSAPFAHTVLLKWVWLGSCLDWVAARFPDFRVVQLVRHPVPQFLSWRARGWCPTGQVRRFLANERLLEGPLAPYREALRDVRGFWQAAAVFWCITTLLQWQQHRPGWVFREHEWFREAPLERLQWLFSELDLEWNEAVERQVNLDPHRKGVRHRGAADSGWRARISDEDYNDVHDIVSAFGLPFYENLRADARYVADRSSGVSGG